MLHTFKLRSRDRIGFTRRLKPLAAALALTLLLPIAASAYVVILRDGRSVNIPEEFTVTRAGITYQYAPGLYVTIQMSSIDMAATERANNEPQGSLLARGGRQSGSSGNVNSRTANQPTARRTLTDKELEPVRARREASEALYEKRRRELGLPSVEETRRQREEETRRLNEQAAQMDSYEAQQEGYWRSRAEELRTRMSVIDAELRYLYPKLRQETELSINDVTFVTVGRPLVLSGPGVFPEAGFPSPSLPRPGRPRMRIPREPLPGRPAYGRDVPRRPFVPLPRPPYGYGRRLRVVNPFLVGSSLSLATPYYVANYDYSRSELNARIRELEAERAGLQTRWRLLEEEARRAGAPPGWLRP